MYFVQLNTGGLMAMGKSVKWNSTNRNCAALTVFSDVVFFNRVLDMISKH